jgi:ATP-binding cassette, subfamily B (MDR/TAP), member 1
MASSLASGLQVQYLTTCITCLVEFFRSWPLGLVILSIIPLLTIIRGFSQAFANPLLAHEREQTGVAAIIIEPAVARISAIKVQMRTMLGPMKTTTG